MKSEIAPFHASTIIATTAVIVPPMMPRIASSQTIYRDSSGSIVRTSLNITLPGSQTVMQFNNAEGGIAGTATQDGYGSTRFYDSSGNEVVNATPTLGD